MGCDKPAHAMQVLIIDDEEGIRLGLELALEDAHQVRTAPSATKGIQAIKALLPDCVLLDMFMENESGDAVLEYLNKVAPEIPVIIISAFSTEVLQKKFGESCKQWIHYRKPIDVAELRKLLAGFEEKRRTHGNN